MKKHDSIPIVIASVACLTIYGWAAGVDSLVRWHPRFAAMQPAAAVGLLFAAIILSALNHPRQIKSEVAVACMAFWLWLTAGLLAVGKILGLRLALGSEPLLYLETDYPSAFMTACLALIGWCGMAYVFNTAHMVRRIRIPAITLIVAGAVAMVGNVLRIPMLTGYVADISAGMAFQSGALLALVGLRFLLFCRSTKRHHAECGGELAKIEAGKLVELAAKNAKRLLETAAGEAKRLIDRTRKKTHDDTTIGR